MSTTIAIDRFAKDITCLDQIYKRLSDFNFFEVLRIDQMEIKHSNMLRWLLDPKSESGIGDKLLKKLLYYCVDNAPNKGNELSPTDIELIDFDDFVVSRESGTEDKKRMDLLIHSNESKLVICIENKINSTERKQNDDEEGQLTEYRKHVEKEYSGSKFRFYILLSPKGVVASEENTDYWMTLSYNEIHSWISEIVTMYETDINSKACFFIKEYIDCLSRNVIDTGVSEMCNTIYSKHIEAFKIFEKLKEKSDDDKTPETKLYYRHKRAIDFVIDNRTTLADSIKNAIAKRLEQSGFKTEYHTNRAPIYVKIPADMVNATIALPGRAIYDDYLRYQVDLIPSCGVFYLHLYNNPRNLPE